MIDHRELLNDVLHRIRRFQIDAHTILGRHERAKSRVYLLEQSYHAVDALSTKQQDLLREAIRCVEFDLFRPAHVVAWAALMDLLQEKLSADGLVKLRSVRPKWKAGSLEELREHVPESQLIDAARELGLLTKNQAKALQGLLNKRNECAHPSGFDPAFNETLGYISEVLRRMEVLRDKSI